MCSLGVWQSRCWGVSGCLAGLASRNTFPKFKYLLSRAFQIEGLARNDDATRLQVVERMARKVHSGL